MTLQVSRRDGAVQLTGPREDVLVLVYRLRLVERLTLAVNGDKASACWAIEEGR